MTGPDSLRLAGQGPGMNAFQRRCSEAIAQVLATHGLCVEFVSHPPAEPAEDGAAMFLRAGLAHGGRHYTLCVYPDGAGASTGYNWYVLQPKDIPSSDALIRTFCDFLARCLAGVHPVTALQEARR